MRFITHPVAWSKRHLRVLVANFIVVGATLPVVIPNLPTQSTVAQPLTAFTQTGSTHWSAANIESTFGNTTFQFAPTVFTGGGAKVAAGVMSNGDLYFYQVDARGFTSHVDLTAAVGAPSPGASPSVFVDPSGVIDIAYISVGGTFVLLSPVQARIRGTRDPHLSGTFRVQQVQSPTTELFSPGTPSVSFVGTTANVFATGDFGSAYAFSITWPSPVVTPQISTPVNVTALTGTPLIGGEPVALVTPASTSMFVALTLSGKIFTFAPTSGGWTSFNVTQAANGAPSSSNLVAGTNGVTTFVAAENSAGDAQLYTVPTGEEMASTASHVTNQPTATWVYYNLTTLIPQAPVFTGSLMMNVTSNAITLASQAASGDLETFTSPLPLLNWTATDLSKTASNASITVGPSLSSATVNNQFVLYVFQRGYLPNAGVGVYAIPQNDWPTAIAHGWPIVADTGALGASTAPWVGFVTSGGVSQSPDFLLGKDIAQAHKPLSWLSFWTVSGPMPGQPLTADNFYTHGFLAGQWVATQIKQYQALGDAGIPNWVILDPEGFPDNHSGLHAPARSKDALYATFWQAILKGWANGLTSVDPHIQPAVYAEQSEYADYSLSTLTMPVFIALAFGGTATSLGVPLPIANGTGNNVLGYIAWGAYCSPPSTLTTEINTLKNAPWGGKFNTLQFNPGVYCNP